jgi:hypothetical protein
MEREHVGKEMLGVIVTLPRGESSSGLACMFRDYLKQNFEDFSSKRRLMQRRLLPTVLTAVDKGMSITLRFAGRMVSIEDGRQAAPLEFRGPFFILTKVASGQRLSWSELRQVRVRGAFRHPIATLLVALLLRTPAALYRNESLKRMA